MQDILSREMQKVHNFESLVGYLRDTLSWPIPDNGLEFDDITFDWSVDLELDEDTQARVVSCRQLRIFDLEFDLSALDPELASGIQDRQQLLIDLSILKNRQPWGIFFIQFENNVELDACRTLLRRVLKRLVDGPNHNPSLPFWQHDRLLFICTTANFQNIGFTCFRGKRGLPIVDDYIPLTYFKLNA